MHLKLHQLHQVARLRGQNGMHANSTAAIQEHPHLARLTFHLSVRRLHDSDQQKRQQSVGDAEGHDLGSASQQG